MYTVDPLISLNAQPTQINRLPILVLNLHNRCNCRCLMCDIWKRTEGSEFTLELFESQMEELQTLGVKWVVLTGGEPLLHSQFPALCVALRRKRIRITLLTSGLLLTKRAGTVANCIDDVIVSLDGPEDIHNKIRGIAGAYNLVAAGIKAVRDMSPGMRISARTTVQKANGSYLRATVDAAHSLDLTGISFLAVDVTSHAFNRDIVWPVSRQDEVCFSRDQLPKLETEIETLIADYAHDIDSGFIADSPAKLRKIVRIFKAHLGEVSHQAPSCNAPWVSAVIETDGSVRPCFFHAPIGNISQKPLSEVLNDKKAVMFRQNLVMKDDPVCQRCVCSLNLKMTDGQTP